MTDNQSFHGCYYMMGMALDVRDVDGQLAAAVPGVPPGFEILMEPIDTDRFRLYGGPLNGSVVEFVRADGGEVSALRAGEFELTKVSPENARTLPVTERLLAPDLELTAEKEAAFKSLFQNLLAKNDGGWVDYDLPYPKYEFIQYLNTQDAVIFHGSNNSGIETFSPVRTSMELFDKSGRGNLQAVYGTHDGLWSMFFAIVNRKQLRGSIRNGVMNFHNRAGETLSVYNFSINQDQLAEQPWCAGALYLLPRGTFVRTKLSEETYSNEWVSEEAVKPIAKLALQPKDFPFLKQIGGHDDGELIRSGELAKNIREAALSAALKDDHFTVRLPVEMDGQLEEYIELQRKYMPAARFGISVSDDAVVLEISALPPAVRQLIAKEYADLLNG